ncbi:family with sequence similarity 90 member A26 [Phyllostomus discolor]|uniref:Family with sequence similarity 90 member A26 n=1 Tax=Phyllostomus discolor TaxID=89673 RepID=A0A833Z380_9CHIR|nr:family with sequence similarity 90 member A26 [Phyllostomus discolor]
MAGRHPQAGPSKPLRAQKGQKQPRAPVAVRAPPVEKEDPRVKCKNCGAFGHKATSTRCPMKRWDGALAPQPVGSNKMKENRKLCSPGDAQNPGSAALPAKEKEQRPSQEDQQRQALLQRFPRRPLGRLQPSRKDQAQTCNYLRHPHQPMPVHTTHRICLGDIGDTTRSPDRNPDEISTVSPIHGAERSTFSPPMVSKGERVPVSDSHHPAGMGFVQGPGSNPHNLACAFIPQAPAKHPDVKSPSMAQPAAHSSGQNSQVSLKAPGKRAAESPVQTCQKPLKKTRLSPYPAPQKTMPGEDPEWIHPVLPPASVPVLTPAQAPQVPRKTPAKGEGVDLPPPPKGRLLSTVYTCPVSQHPLVSQRQGQPLRMVLRRLKGGQWSSRLLSTPSVLPAEEPVPPAQSPPSPGRSEAPCSSAASSDLHEDLQVSSSSEDNEDLQDFSFWEDSDD